MKKIDLPTIDGDSLEINSIFFRKIWDELEIFLDQEKGMDNLEFVKRILFDLEIKSNNTVEGINDPIDYIEKAIKEVSNSNNNRKERIVNLYKGYKFILEEKEINVETLKKLYSILSDKLLIERDLSNMGQIYRDGPVYILNKGRLDRELDEGVPVEKLEYFMNKYLDFVNNGFVGTDTEQFIKSQIMHFYFVYIHPFFDVNGRTSRTLAMWHLINTEAYPYIIFNRAINFSDGNYDNIIGNCKANGNISLFIKYMMENVKVELEKEMIMRQIKQNTSAKMTAMDFQALLYILSMNGDCNVLTFSSFYREKNGFKTVKEIYENIIKPLIEKGIIVVEGTTKKIMFDGLKNEKFRLNDERYDRNSSMIKRLILK